jgi:catechol 2,3-dioxygenase-like lactoylglutathione lyase family enzyme
VIGSPLFSLSQLGAFGENHMASQIPSVTRVLETALYSDNLPRAAKFYRDLFAFDTLVETERIVALDVAGESILLLFNRGESGKGLKTSNGWMPPHDSTGPAHFAFGIERDELEAWETRLTARGVEIESRVSWELGGASVYFRDPDGHSVELATRGTWRTY